MIKLVYCITKKPGLTDEEFFHYWEHVHGPIGARIPGFHVWGLLLILIGLVSLLVSTMIDAGPL